MSEHSLEPVLTRIADALDRLAPRPVVQHGLKAQTPLSGIQTRTPRSCSGR